MLFYKNSARPLNVIQIRENFIFRTNMDKRNYLKVGRYDTCTFHFFLVFWDTLIYIFDYKSKIYWTIFKALSWGFDLYSGQGKMPCVKSNKDIIDEGVL